MTGTAVFFCGDLDHQHDTKTDADTCRAQGEATRTGVTYFQPPNVKGMHVSERVPSGAFVWGAW